MTARVIARWTDAFGNDWRLVEGDGEHALESSGVDALGDVRWETTYEATAEVLEYDEQVEDEELDERTRDYQVTITALIEGIKSLASEK